MSDDPRNVEKERSIPLLQEELEVSRRDITAGKVRVSTVTHERTQQVEEMLSQERIEVEHVAMDRYIDAVPDIREEGDTTIIPVVEEVLVVERRLRLKEEVHIHRVRTTTPYREEVTLREQDAVVTRDDDEGMTTSE
ncbi:DUF2382 domain-containing protein [Phytohalomonas tamaricis]|uniref:DUF2382 domain-containing protein n=1 Tax=Phytohalomonas tamaricis TaxID=2081032 RepID=UPI000D0B94AB|nr:DUF2382 domain-containing protein [Phytohalomonas tamaricis]